MNLASSSLDYSSSSLKPILRTFDHACFGLAHAQINGGDGILQAKLFQRDSGFVTIGRARCVAFDHPIVEALVFIKIPSR